jgi:beta-lactam-binding protein with PASTA domain/tRNA A-37 threonylcarbamoyl transferase component Bud32
MIGRLLDGRYQVRSRIARGGMATVYLATDLRLERRVAIKIMHGHLADDSQFRERFIQEARSAARLAHPNVVNVFDQGQDSDMAYLVMEYLPGITLRDLLTEHKVLNAEQTIDILEAVLSGLAAAHKAGIVHRDLKPENVLLADDGRIKIGDFGLARAASANTATGAALLGTIAYLSPELVTRGIADTRSDIYAVGIMMYEMLAGEQPFKGEQPMQIAYQHANDSVPTPSTKNPRVPAELDELVLWATAREPDERPRDARALLEQLFETRKQLDTALVGTSTSQLRTVVMPAALGNVGNDNETQVITSGAPARAASSLTPATGALSIASEKRRARGWWIFALIIVLAGLSGGTGWYFGLGPGSMVTIPASVVGMSPDAAAAQLTEAGITVSDERPEVHSPDIGEGLVASTDPVAGTSIPRDSVVTIQISKGPSPVVVPEIIGVPEADAIALLEDSGLISAGREEQFSSAIAPGIVIAAFGEGNDGERISLENGDSYFDQRPVTLLVSLGPLPNVSGLSVDAATAALADVNVSVASETQRTFSDSIAEGIVIQAISQVRDAPVKPGDTVVLVVSRGPDLVEVPDVAGDTIADAVATLKAAGFAVDVRTDVPEEDWDRPYVRVASTEPGAGKVKRGTTIIVRGLI